MSDDDSAVPASPDQYRTTIPGFEGATVNTAAPRFKAAAAAAHAHGFSHKQFGAVLALEAQRVAASRHAAPAATQAQQQPAKIEGWDRMSFHQKLAAGGHL